MGTSRWIKIFGLDQQITRQQIADHIQRTGNVKIGQNRIYLSKSDVKSLVHVEIECPNHCAARTLSDKLTLTNLSGTRIWAQIVENVKGSTKIVKLSFSNKEVSKEDILEMISECSSNLKSPRIISFKQRTKDPLGFARVMFDSAADAARIGEKLNGQTLKGGELCIQWPVSQEYIECWRCGQRGHYGKGCPEWKSINGSVVSVKAKSVRKLIANKQVSITKSEHTDKFRRGYKKMARRKRPPNRKRKFKK